MERMRLGVVILPEWPWSEAQAAWRRAEELGFEHAWTYDHLAWRSFRDSTWFAAVPTLAAAALATARIRLGTLVASPNFRHPVPFAREIVSLDDLSRGRFTLGIGAGGSGFDATMLGQAPWSPRERADRFAEFVELCDRLLRQRETTHAGRFYSASEARTWPGCVQRPRVPFAIAATGPRGMRLAARYGESWVTTGDPARTGPLGPVEGARMIREQIARLEDACAEEGRDPASLRRLVLSGLLLDGGLASVEAFRETSGRYAEAGATDFIVHWPRPDAPFAADPATFERIALECAAARGADGAVAGEATGSVHHVDLTVRDLRRSTDFYSRVLPLLGFRRSGDAPEGPIFAGARMDIAIRADRPGSGAAHDRYAPGLHHLAFAAPSRAAVDALHRRLVELGVPILDAPAEYPRYASQGYYAVFFADPDGIKLEYVFTPVWPS
jgi:alkanesulfonate monooxygenase SsuD/methylene tetrahydromethanopterin reductase-like flavin-dependent oxidoreductase (luciferase family)